MKKHFLLLVMTFVSLASWAAPIAYEEDANTHFRFLITSPYTPAVDETPEVLGEATILGFVADYTDYATTTIDEVVNGNKNGGGKYKVTAIEGTAFNGNAGITKVVINKYLTNISTAFAGCANLAEIDLSKASGLTSIGEGGFVGTKIATLDLSKTQVTAIDNWFTVAGADATATNDKLTSVTLPDNWATISNDAFVGCTALATVNFGTAPQYVDPTADEPVAFPTQTIGDGAFAKTAIVKLNLSGTNLTTIPALFGTTISATAELNIAYPSLTEVKLPTTWTTIAEYAFANCTNLATFNMGEIAATAIEAHGDQSFGTQALAGTAVTALDFSKTKVTGVTANLLYDGTVFKKNTTLQTVTINNFMVTVAEEEVKTAAISTAFANCEALTTFTGLDAAKAAVAPATEPTPYFNAIPDGAFEGDILLATISTSTIKTFGASAFKGCAALTSIDLSAATTLGVSAFEGAGLTAVTIPGTVASIPASAFKNCEALATVTFGHNTVEPVATTDPALQPITEIGAYAFYGTAFTSIVIPCTFAETATIGDRAFADSKVADFTLKPVTPKAGMVNENAFVGCDAVKFHTITAYVTLNPTAPKKCTYVEEDPEIEPVLPSTLPATESKKASQAGKYYVKFKNTLTSPIKVKATDAKVYAAYLDATTFELNMQMFKSKGGYYHIAQGDVVLMLTSLSAVPYTGEDAIVAGTSWVKPVGTEGVFDVDEINQLKYVTAEDGELRSNIEADAPATTPDIYGWINNATNGYGFQKITSGKTFPKGTLYVLAKAPAEGAAARVIWRDEDGNIEDETTAIEGIVEAKAENGAIYNLAGQKVNASYKGLIIKDGKKYMK